MSEYALLKLLHLGALVFWLGPPLGAWLVLKGIESGLAAGDTALARVNRVFFLTLILEHVAFVVLLATGFTLVYRYQLFGPQWLDQKLVIVLLVIVPLEIVDVLLGNWVASQASGKLHAGKPLKSWETRGLALYHGTFTRIALMVIPVSVLAIMYLAISKAGLETLL